MNLYVLIIGLCICALSTGVFLFYRTKKGGLAGLFSKIVASLCFVLLAIFLAITKMNTSYYGGLAIALLIAGLVCGLIGDVLLDLKVMYAFHEKQYLVAGMTAFFVAHLFNTSAILVIINSQINLFLKWQTLLLIVGGCLLLTLVTWFVNIKMLKLNYQKHSFIVNAYSFILFLTTALSIYSCFLGLNIFMPLLAIGFVFFLFSDLVLSTQYFGGKQNNTNLTFVNHLLYYVAQIIIASFIYFI